MRDSSGHGRRVLLISLARYVYRVTATSATPGSYFYFTTRSKPSPNSVSASKPKTPNSPGTSGIILNALAL